MGLHAIPVFKGVDNIAAGCVQAGFALDEFDVRLELPAHRRWNESNLLKCLVVAVGNQQGGDQALPGIDAVRIPFQYLVVCRVSMRGVVALQIDGRQLQLD